MPNFNNLDDLMKHIKNNTKEVIEHSNEGKDIECECPYCKEVTKIKIIKDGSGKCEKCKNIINITWEGK